MDRKLDMVISIYPWHKRIFAVVYKNVNYMFQNEILSWLDTATPYSGIHYNAVFAWLPNIFPV